LEPATSGDGAGSAGRRAAAQPIAPSRAATPKTWAIVEGANECFFIVTPVRSQIWWSAGHSRWSRRHSVQCVRVTGPLSGLCYRSHRGASLSDRCSRIAFVRSRACRGRSHQRSSVPSEPSLGRSGSQRPQHVAQGLQPVHTGTRRRQRRGGERRLPVTVDVCVSPGERCVKCNFSTTILLKSHDAFGAHVWRTVGIGQHWVELEWARIGCPEMAAPGRCSSRSDSASQISACI